MGADIHSMHLYSLTVFDGGSRLRAILVLDTLRAILYTFAAPGYQEGESCR